MILKMDYCIRKNLNKEYHFLQYHLNLQVLDLALQKIHQDYLEALILRLMKILMVQDRDIRQFLL